eukprot:COSAG04_NODE_15120_length_543_cov_0.628378_2_plen_53_part_01
MGLFLGGGGTCVVAGEVGRRQPRVGLLERRGLGRDEGHRRAQGLARGELKLAP